MKTFQQVLNIQSIVQTEKQIQTLFRYFWGICALAISGSLLFYFLDSILIWLIPLLSSLYLNYIIYLAIKDWQHQKKIKLYQKSIQHFDVLLQSLRWASNSYPAMKSHQIKQKVQYISDFIDRHLNVVEKNPDFQLNLNRQLEDLLQSIDFLNDIHDYNRFLGKVKKALYLNEIIHTYDFKPFKINQKDDFPIQEFVEAKQNLEQLLNCVQLENLTYTLKK